MATTTTISLKEYLVGSVNFPVTDDAIKTIAVQRNITPDASYSELEAKVFELCKADLYVWICTSPGRLSSTTDSDNGWSHSGGGFSLSTEDKKSFMALANSIYEKYGEDRKGIRKVTIRDGGVKRANTELC